MNWWKKDLWEENFRGLLAGATKNIMPPNLAEKTFTNSHKTLKFPKLSSLAQSCLLYGSMK